MQKETKSCKRKDFSYSRTRSGIIDIDFHLHNSFEIFYLVSGDVNYFIENKVYDLRQDDIIITNKYEIHKPSFRSDKVYERIILQFSPEILKVAGFEQYEPFQCLFDREKGESNRISLNRSQRFEVLRLFNRYDQLDKRQDAAAQILMLAYLIELLVILNEAFYSTERKEEPVKISEKITSVIDFIGGNLQQELSLEKLEKEFHINRCYLSRLFKKCTGVNIHDYIIHKRIAKAKELLSSGYNVTETCYLTGFGDYSNYLRMFRRIVGITPGRYKSELSN